MNFTFLTSQTPRVDKSRGARCRYPLQRSSDPRASRDVIYLCSWHSRINLETKRPELKYTKKLIAFL